MNRNDLTHYRKKILKDLVVVDEAISDDAYLAKDEWFDFLFKSYFVGYRSWNIKLYRSFHKGICKLAEVYAEAFSYLVDIRIEGFDNVSYIKYIKRVISRMNALTTRKGRVKVSGYDKDGVLYIKLLKGSNKSETFSVSSRDEAVDKFEYVIRYCTHNTEIFPRNREFGNFLVGYLGGELSKVVNNISPYPYVCCNRCTLQDILSTSVVDMQEVSLEY